MEIWLKGVGDGRARCWYQLKPVYAGELENLMKHRLVNTESEYEEDTKRGKRE